MNCAAFLLAGLNEEVDGNADLDLVVEYVPAFTLAAFATVMGIALEIENIDGIELLNRALTEAIEGSFVNERAICNERHNSLIRQPVTCRSDEADNDVIG